MANHFHSIIQIGENEFNTQGRDAMHCVSTTETNGNNETNSVLNPKIWRLLSVDLNPPLQERPVKFIPISSGNHDSMIILFAMKKL